MRFYRNADLIIGGQHWHSIHSTHSPHLIDSLAYFQNDVTWCVQKAKGIAKWKTIFKVADPIVMACISVAAFFVTSSVWMFLGFEKPSRDIWSAALLTTASIAATPYKIKPKKTSVRIFYLYLLIMSFLGASVLVSFLFAISTHPMYEHQIANFEEVISKKIHLAAERETKDFLIDWNMVNIVIFNLRSITNSRKKIPNHESVK